MRKIYLFLCLLTSYYLTDAQAGSFDPSFGVNGVEKIQYFSKGTIVSDKGESFAIEKVGEVGGNNRYWRVTKYLSNGLVDLSYGTNGSTSTFIMQYATGIIREDGKLVVVGTVGYPYHIHDQTRVIIFNTDGTLYYDQTTQEIGLVYQLPSRLVKQQGQVLLYGYAVSYASNFNWDYVGYAGGSTIYSSPSRNNNYTYLSVNVQEFSRSRKVAVGNGSLIVAGLQVITPATFPYFPYTNFIVSKYVNGVLDSTFNHPTSPIGYDNMLLTPTGKLVLFGSVANTNTGNSDFYIARYNKDGSPDLSFNGNGIQTTDFGAQDTAISIVLQDDKIILAGSTTNKITGDKEFAIARYNNEGTLDNSFSEDGKQTLGEEGHAYLLREIKINGNRLLALGDITSKNGETFKVTAAYKLTTSNPSGCTATGSILREYWANVPGTHISDIPVNSTPSSTSQLNSFETPADVADYYGQRIRGYICAPATGNYTFYVSGDDESELWLSTSDNPGDKRKIAFVGGMQWTNPREWTKYESQKSVTIFLQANTKYYIEALNKEGAGGDNLAVGWITPGTSDVVVIPGSVLSPFIGTTNPPVVCTATGSILREYWANVTGTLISDIPVNSTPSSTSELNAFEAPTDIADNYAQRIRGYICAPATGNYTFYISGDDESELWLSTSDNPADKRKIASVGGMQWTNPREWTKYESQKSVTIFLQANTKYYIEALNKEGAGGDNLAVGWVTPGTSDIVVIPGSVLSPFTGTNNPPVVCTATGTILREYWANVTGTLISDIPVNATPSSTSQLNNFEAPTDIADNYAQRIRGYICAPATGNYTFYISGDDESELWLSTTDNPADKRKIASVGGMQWTNPKEWIKYESQKSVTIFLQANTKYYIEALNKEGAGGDNLSVGWITPGGSDIVVIPGSVLSPFTGTNTPPVVCTATGSILREYWENVTGTFISDIPVNSTPSSTSQLNSFEAPTDIADNYAQRIRGYICAPATGNYTFYISGDDESELWLSTSDNPADKRKIAWVGGMQWTNPREWTKYESQKSVTIFLQANTKYYIEALNKEGAGGDNLSVGWITPGGSDIVVIPGSVLSPFTGTNTQTSTVIIPNAPVTSKSLRKVADDVSNSQLFLKALPNPTSTHFIINLKSGKLEPVDLKVLDAVGRVIETKRKVPSNGSVTIGDGYHTGIYYLQAVQGSERVTLKLIKGVF